MLFLNFSLAITENLLFATSLEEFAISANPEIVTKIFSRMKNSPDWIARIKSVVEQNKKNQDKNKNRKEKTKSKYY
jgi:hypothetical protein